MSTLLWYWFKSSLYVAVAVKVVNETTSQNTATIWLQVSGATANLTIIYGLCSEPPLNYTTMPFMQPEKELVNLTAETMYCYSISATASDRTVFGSCDGTFTTEEEATPSPTMPGKKSVQQSNCIMIICILLWAVNPCMHVWSQPGFQKILNSSYLISSVVGIVKKTQLHW